jgi:hypothetical protein
MSSIDAAASPRSLYGDRRVDAVVDQGGLLVADPWSVERSQDARAAGCGLAAPSSAGSGDQMLTPEEIAAVISVALRAPSIHNTQPWKFRPWQGGIDLLGDPDRTLPGIDPQGRELMISCGAALFGLRLGLRKLGRLPSVVVQPDPAQPWLVARVSAVGHAAQTRAEADLITAVPHRHTHRGPFTPGEVAARLLSAMVTDAAAEGCELRVIRAPQVIASLGRLVRAAAAQQQSSAELTAELGRWVRPPGSDARDGVPAWARVATVLETSAAGATSERFDGRDFGLPGTEDPSHQPPSATAVLLTHGDTTADWVRAGQALDRVLLRAAARWVFASLQSQPLECARHRPMVRELLGGRGYPQMLLQLGRANTAPATPRRPQAEVRAELLG